MDVVIGMPHRGRINLLTGALQVPAIALLHKVSSVLVWLRAQTNVGKFVHLG